MLPVFPTGLIERAHHSGTESHDQHRDHLLDHDHCRHRKAADFAENYLAGSLGTAGRRDPHRRRHHGHGLRHGPGPHGLRHGRVHGHVSHVFANSSDSVSLAGQVSGDSGYPNYMQSTRAHVEISQALSAQRP